MTNTEYDIKEIQLSIPVNLIMDGDCYILSTTDKSEKLLNQSICVQGKSMEDTESKFWQILKATLEYHEERSKDLDRWKPFQKGDWTQGGGRWFTIFGIHFYFRYGKQMRHGTYIPFTKLNIMISNYWRKPLYANSISLIILLHI